MSLRARMGLAAGLAVAIAVVAVAVSAYAGTRSELLGQRDAQLRTLITPILQRAGAASPPPAASGTPDDATGGGGSGGSIVGGTPPAGGNDCDHGLGLDRARGGPFGGAQGYVQLVNPGGSVCLASGETVKLPVTDAVLDLARSGRGSFAYDAPVRGDELRVLAAGVRSYGAVQVALDMSNVDSALHRQVVLLIIIGASGIALAALLGIVVARTAVAPIARFTRQTESIAANPARLDEQRLEVHGSDEIARLAQTFNRTLDALEASVQAQRNLVADASHELRTPIATIRANLQLMRDEELLSPDDRAALRQDIIEELDELTALVGDVVELARGAKPTGARGDVRVDQVVDDALDRARRRWPELRVDARIEPTLVHGEGDRIARAVTNLLDNAAKYGGTTGHVEVTLQGGVLTVRDHGPGFHPDDLPFVFDRFHRARSARSRPGSGLGLAIVRQAAEAHGGHVEAANAPGGGALMRVTFGPVLQLEDDPAPGAVSRS